jgi:hypothetical protein
MTVASPAGSAANTGNVAIQYKPNNSQQRIAAVLRRWNGRPVWVGWDARC